MTQDIVLYPCNRLRARISLGQCAVNRGNAKPCDPCVSCEWWREWGVTVAGTPPTPVRDTARRQESADYFRGQFAGQAVVMADEWRPAPGCPGYTINAAGEMRNRRGEDIPIARVVEIWVRGRQVQRNVDRLRVLAFGEMVVKR